MGALEPLERPLIHLGTCFFQWLADPVQVLVDLDFQSLQQTGSGASRRVAKSIPGRSGASPGAAVLKSTGGDQPGNFAKAVTVE